RGGRDGERYVVRICVLVGIGPVPEVTRVVIVQQIVMTGLAVRTNRPVQRTQVTQDRADAGLRRIGAVAVATAAVNSDGWAIVAVAAVAVLRPPVISPSYRIRIFDFIDRTAKRCNATIGVIWVRRDEVAILILKPEGIAKKEHDRIEAGPAHGWLM